MALVKCELYLEGELRRVAGRIVELHDMRQR